MGQKRQAWAEFQPWLLFSSPRLHQERAFLQTAVDRPGEQLGRLRQGNLALGHQPRVSVALGTARSH